MEIRDSRDKEWFWMDNEYLNGYARHLGASCTVVYFSLCRHANNKTQKCFPSMKLVAEENGISTRTVVRAVAKLEEWNIISVKKEKKKDGTQANNVYTLLSKKVWKSKPSDIKSHGSPSDNNDTDRVTPGTCNNTNINNTNLAKAEPSLVSEVIKLFEEVNPACGKMYGNTTQRQSSQKLIDTYGFDEVSKVIAILPKTNKMEYMPSITTPHLLWLKYQQLKDRLEQKKSELQAKKVKVI